MPTQPEILEKRPQKQQIFSYIFGVAQHLDSRVGILWLVSAPDPHGLVDRQTKSRVEVVSDRKFYVHTFTYS